MSGGRAGAPGRDERGGPGITGSGQDDADGLPVPRTAEGRAGLAAIRSDPGTALIAMDFDGTLAPIVADPGAARAHPAAVPALRALSGHVGTLALITGRPAGAVVELGGFAEVERGTSNAVVTHYNIQSIVQIFATTQGRDLGGVSDDVAHEARCDVLLVR